MSIFFRPFRSSGNWEGDEAIRRREREDHEAFLEEQRMDAEKRLDEAKGKGKRDLRERLEALAKGWHERTAPDNLPTDRQIGIEAAYEDCSTTLLALLAESAEGEKTREKALSDALWKYGQHAEGCPAGTRLWLEDVENPKPCTCGLHVILFPHHEGPMARRAPRDEGLNRRYVRFGDLPKGGRSRNHLTGELENGVSVYDAVEIDGQIHVVLPSLDESACVSLSGILRRPMYEVSGRAIGKGGDGEPILADAALTRPAPDERVIEDRSSEITFTDDDPAPEATT